MSLDAMKQVAQTEQMTRDRKAEAMAAAKRTVAEAERSGKAHLEEARVKAEGQARGFLSQAEEKAARHTEEVLAQTQKACEELREKAAGRLDEAAALIVGRVVNS